ncbi:tetratricopeptide (TPR) repeat protein [Catenuloplanes nepalensis]|uniref:Tetratricopeptide (TPR) repeat protein n=1 Tax=Catenuloplanes nepalensis TaxID=587533 RepID=A0ABT9MQR8_9ACTN|nr:tetratricopeptide repeat protein [Catenuloplanes nepalensis]MDP9793779.1 tetratricopeptide (TPR) repeat protein [Catenuloplanes nepalensis]
MSSWTVPRQIPAGPAGFVGRDRELDRLDALAAPQPGGPAVVVLTGVGGVGKSALALHWAHAAAGRYPDGQLYAQLGAFDPAGPADPADVVAVALRALGLADDRIPARPAERTALFRTVTSGLRLLILLDDAVSAAQIRPLLPASAHAAVLVTARWRLGALALDGAGFLPVAPLPEDAATEMLRRRIGNARLRADREATRSLLRRCAGLPVALAVSAARLASRPRWPVRRMVDELNQDSVSVPGGMSLATVFELSYRDLDAPVAHCYRALGAHPGAECGVPVVAAMLEVTEPEAAALLDQLIEASLVDEAGADGDRFRLHDLVRRHARRAAGTGQEWNALLRRAAEWYRDGAAAAGRLLTPYRNRPARARSVAAVHDRHTALAWFDAERPNLVAAVLAAAGPFPLLAWQIADECWPMFHLRRHHADRQVVDRAAAECARRLGDPAGESEMIKRLAWSLYDTGRYDEAEPLFTRAMTLAADGGDHAGLGGAHAGLGTVALARGRHDEARAHSAAQHRIFTELGDVRSATLGLLRLGQVENEAGHPAEAVTYLRQTVTLLAGLGVDPYNEAVARAELGRALTGLGEHESAERELAHALSEMDRLGSARGRAQALHRRGELHARAGRQAEARADLTAAEEAYARLADTEAAQVRRLLDELAGRP